MNIERSISELMNLYGKFTPEALNEATVKAQIVKPFLEIMGYNQECFRYENPTYSNKKRVDISIYDSTQTNKILFVEVKRGSEELTIDDSVQLANYLNEVNIDWGILTNGITYILFNNKVNGNSTQKEVLRFQLDYEKLNKTHQYRYVNNLKYFSYDYIFESKVTNYFRYLADFKIIMKKDFSFRQYESTVYGFLNYLSEYKKPFELINIRPTSFKSFLIQDIDNKKSKKARHAISKDTIRNKYRYIKSFCNMLKEHKHIQTNLFDNITESEMFKGIEFTEKNLEIEPLTNDEIDKILSSYNNMRYAIRNKLIFLLFLYTAQDISDIKSLKMKDLNLTNNTININNHYLPIPDNLLKLINEYIEFRNINKIKCKYLFYTNYNGEYDCLKDCSYNEIISEQFNSIDIPEERKKYLKPSFIKYSVITKMIGNGIHIDEIVKFTGMSLTNLEAFISYADIYKKGKYERIIKKHPYKDYLFSK